MAERRAAAPAARLEVNRKGSMLAKKVNYVGKTLVRRAHCLLLWSGP